MACILRNKLIFALCVLMLPVLSMAAQQVDEIVAVVNDEVILASELGQAIQQARAQLGPQARNMPPAVLQSKVLDHLITTRLQLERAKMHDLSVSPDEIQQGLARLAQQNNMQVDQFIDMLHQRRIPMQAIRDQIKEDLLIEKVRNIEVMQKVSVSDEEVSQFLKTRALQNYKNREYKLQMIRLNIPDEDEGAEKTREKAQKLRQQASEKPDNFGSLAKTWSDADNAKKQGQLGWVDAAFMRQAFVDIVPKLDEGAISRVFRDANAFYILKLNDTRSSKNATQGQKLMVDEVKAQHIVLKPNTLRDQTATRNLAQKLRKKIKDGADFSQVARAYSDDDQTARQGGELGWVIPQTINSPEAKFLSKLQPGQVSPVIQTQDGYALVTITKRRRRDKTQDAIRARARQQLGREKAERQGQIWLKSLRSRAYIDIRLDNYQAN